MKAMSRERFDAFCMLTKDPLTDFVADEVEWYSDDAERLIGALFRDTTDGDHCYVLLARDEGGRFRAIRVQCDCKTLQNAWVQLKDAMAEEGIKDHPGWGQDATPSQGTDLFGDCVAEDKAHPAFHLLKASRGHSSARAVIEEMMPHLRNLDGNFVEQFQSTGFDARLWELYLFAYFREERLRTL